MVVVWLLIVSGCSGNEYPGAPVINLHQTSVNYLKDGTLNLKYRLEAEEPLPYTIFVYIAVEGQVYGEDGVVYDIEAIFWDNRSTISTSLRVKMQEGTTVLGKTANNPIYYIRPDGNSDISKQIKTLSLKLLEWNGLGDAPYNVGSPSQLIVGKE